jgi:sulfoxide reductase heme-binding subunit YedZ
MSNRYVIVQWNRHKKLYDIFMLAAIVLYLAVYLGLGFLLHRHPSEISVPVLVLRALGSLAIVLLHIVLSIGPLCRLDPRFTPLLYNRRHLGIGFFIIVLLHFVIALGYYGGFGSLNPLSALLAGSGTTGISFELYGFLAFLIFFVMAATSHDFWLANLGPRFWKMLHMCVYGAYVLVLLHVVNGAMQDRAGLLAPLLLAAGVLWLCAIHIAAGLRERDGDGGHRARSGWVDVCDVEEIPESRARVVCIGSGERIAIVKHNGKVTAVSNVCSHQGGPLGEGQVVDGCLTCPWHGYQYDPASGKSPPPYTEQVKVYEVRVDGQRVMLNPEPIDTESETLHGNT